MCWQHVDSHTLYPALSAENTSLPLVSFLLRMNCSRAMRPMGLEAGGRRPAGKGS